ncbi:DinB family protein [Savagea faecisuis]|uniref:DinB family protein n=1 Tax=Savagea faecisuis TaxID=1274803 RepID=A0ABW3GZF5_9BACL
MNVQQKIDSITNYVNEIVDVVSKLDDEVIAYIPSEEEWSIAQVLSHLNEAIPYWLGEVENVIATPGSKWGRGLQHEGRLEAVANPMSINGRAELETLKTMPALVVEKINGLTDEQLAAENPHRNFERFGNKPVAFIIDHFIDEHAATHLKQIRRNISKWNER